ncbi:thermonuclease family protein [Planctomycetota bacterium]
MAVRNKTIFAMSSRRLKTLIILSLLAAGSLYLLDHRPAGCKWRQAETDSQTQTADFAKYNGKTFTVTNIVDGDTLDIDVPDGQNNTTRICLWGIDTPETKSPQTGVMYFGPEAAEFAKELALGKQVTVYLDEGNNTRGYYGRLLAYIKLAGGGFLNEVMLTEGFAYADSRFRHSLYNKYRQLEAVAKSQKKGLWEKVTDEQLPEWLQSKKPNLLNK